MGAERYGLDAAGEFGRGRSEEGIEHGWPRQIERHKTVTDRIRGLLADPGESTEPDSHNRC
ncbi:hypothetical protein [Streptomyces sp. NPDC058603]|uniref:hypothetical protein n=1 Tax=Streptomyces sp. NPDC058603 TaxID=3346551 RepID=UPI0036696845